jgi:hypothetical protein
MGTPKRLVRIIFGAQRTFRFSSKQRNPSCLMSHDGSMRFGWGLQVS